MRTDYEYIFLGCSCFAMGCAAQKNEDCLILEQNESIGGEFTEALYTTAVQKPEGKALAFYEELIDRGIMSEESARRGEIHLPAVQVVLNRLALEYHLHILFRTQIIRIEKKEAGYEIEAVCNARILHFTCRKIIDTRSSDFDLIRRHDPQAQCYLAANLHAPHIPHAPWPGTEIRKGFLPGEAFLQMQFPAPSPWNRGLLMKAFEDRPGDYLPLTLLLIPQSHGISCQKIRVETAYGLFIPGCSFGNPVQAWEAGLNEKEAFC